MLPVIVGAAAFGALLMGRTKPKTKATKKVLLGPRTGNTYQVEDFAEAGFIVVRAADGSRAVFVRSAVAVPGCPGFTWQHGQGNPASLQAMNLDICGPPKEQVAKKEPASHA